MSSSIYGRCETWTDVGELGGVVKKVWLCRPCYASPDEPNFVVRNGMAVCTPTGFRRAEARIAAMLLVEARRETADADRARNGRGDRAEAAS